MDLTAYAEIWDSLYQQLQAMDRGEGCTADSLSWGCERCLSPVIQGEWNAVGYLFYLFQLKASEQQCVLLALSAELSPLCGAVIAKLQGGMRVPTLALALELIPSLSLGFFVEKSALMEGFFQLFTSRDERTLPEQQLKLRPEVLRFVLTDGAMMQEKTGCQWIVPNRQTENDFTSFGESVFQTWSRGFLRCAETRSTKMTIPACYYLFGVDGIGKKTQLFRLAKKSGVPILCVDCRWLCEQRESVIDALLWEWSVQQCFMALEHWENALAESLRRVLTRFFDRAKPLLLLSREPPNLSALAPYSVRPVALEMPSMAESAALWRFFERAYPIGFVCNEQELAGLFELTPKQIHTVLAGAYEQSESERITTEQLKAVCRRNLSVSHGGLVQTIRRAMTWEDLILPEDVKKELKSMAAQVRNRYLIYEGYGLSQKIAYGTGVSMLFSGSAGTGKSMAAQVIAHELGVELYRVNLATVVSKYIGETEKNLNCIFEEGRASQAMLFFDEADVLFSKRTEIRDSNDKYSNMEAAFMLQKMEEYTGTVILATNYLQNIDEAFKRRLTCIVEFPLPNEELRFQLWSRCIPERLQLAGEVDLEFLAHQFSLSGSQIKNCVRNAAFLLAEEGGAAVKMSHFLQAIRGELAKVGKKIPDAELCRYLS